MDGGVGFRKDGKKTKVIKSYKGHPKGTWHNSTKLSIHANKKHFSWRVNIF